MPRPRSRRSYARTAFAASRRAGRRFGLAALLVLLAAGSVATAEEPAPLRVGTSGDYAPFSVVRDEHLDGFDVALARRFAADTGRPLVLVRFAWPDLSRRLAAGEFDVAFSGVTVRPERSLVGRFSAPVTESGAVVLVRGDARFSELAALDDPAVSLAVNAGGHLERATRARFPRARVIALPDNGAVVEELVQGRADGAVTDTLEAPAWEARAPGTRRLGPFTRDRKAALVRADDPALAAAIDAWLAAREADGSLAALRERWLADGARAPTAAPLPALVAALDERLSLMPFVAEAKRAAGRPLRDPEQEGRVIDAALAATVAEARKAGRPAPSEACVRGLFSAQIEAASAVQARVLARPAADTTPPDLEREIRPALARLTPRVAAALVALPPDLPPATLREALEEGLRAPDLDAASREALASALLRCAGAAAP